MRASPSLSHARRRLTRPAAGLLVFALSAAWAATAQADTTPRTEAARDTLAQLRAHKPLRVGMHAGLIPFAAAGGEADELRAMTDHGPAAHTTDGRSVAGFDVDLARAAARALGVPLEITLVDRFEDLLPGLIAGRYDVVMSGLTRTLSRATLVAFSDPYFASGLQIFVPAPARFSALQELGQRHARIAVRADTTADSFARSNMSGATIVPFSDATALFAAIDAGQVDAAVLDYVNARDAQLRGHLRAHLIALEDRRFTVEHFAFAARQGDPDWVAWLDLFLRESKASGEFHAVAARYNPWFRSER